MTLTREAVETALFEGFVSTPGGGRHEGWSRNMARIAADAVMPIIEGERKEVAKLLRRRAVKEAPNAQMALLFMADVVDGALNLPEHMLGEVSETALVKELRYLPGLVLGRRRGELVPLADFTRERIAKALTDAANALEADKHKIEADALRRYRDALRENRSAASWELETILHDIEEWADSVEAGEELK